MKPCSPIPLFVPLAFLAVSCTQNPSQPDPVPQDLSATQSADLSPRSTITQIEELDIDANGTVDGRFTTVTSYDAHGNRARVAHWSEGPIVREPALVTATIQCTPHGAEFAVVQEIDEGRDGTVDDITTLTTLEVDQRGNPISQRLADDIHADGSIDNVRTWTNEFDARGRKVKTTEAAQVFDMAYDAHGNLTGYRSAASNSPHTVIQWNREYTRHDALVRSTETWTDDRRRDQLTTLTTVEYDSHGYPTRQVVTVTQPRTAPQRIHQTIAYDAHHNVAVVTYEQDYQSNGTVDLRSVVRYEYSRPDQVPAGVARGSMGLMAGGPEGLLGAARDFHREGIGRPAAVLEH